MSRRISAAANDPTRAFSDSHALHLQAAALMALPDPSRWILPDSDRFASQPRNLTMDALQAALERPYRTT